MKYIYLYQTKENENRKGEIKAPNRAEAYALLRKSGIRPYRLIGDDPKNWRPWAIGGVIAALAVAVGVLAFSLSYGREFADNRFKPAQRAQIAGDIHEIARLAQNNWSEVLSTRLDRLLASYAQPGWSLQDDTELAEDEIDTLAADLEIPLERSEDESPETRQLKNILLTMRSEMKAHLANGGTVRDHLEFLAERQNREREIREKALETLSKAPQDMKRRAWANLNARLGDMGLALLPEINQ